MTTDDAFDNIDVADYQPTAPRRGTRRFTSAFNPSRRDVNAPIIALIEHATAACASDPDPDRWFDNLQGGGSQDMRRLCQHCPLHRACLDYALRHDVLGFWGGTNASERQRLRDIRGIKAEAISWLPWLRGDA